MDKYITASSKDMGRINLLTVYYLLTPLFFFLDYVFQQNIRLSGLENTAIKNIWYVVCLGFGILFYLRPGWSILLSLLESMMNLILLIFVFVIPVIVPDVNAIERGEIYFTKSSVINFIISGTICVFVFEKAKEDIKRRFISK